MGETALNFISLSRLVLLKYTMVPTWYTFYIYQLFLVALRVQKHLSYQSKLQLRSAFMLHVHLNMTAFSSSRGLHLKSIKMKVATWCIIQLPSSQSSPQPLINNQSSSEIYGNNVMHRFISLKIDLMGFI